MLDQVLKESKRSLNKSDLPILAIDYGQRRIGIALSDQKGSIASPLSVVTRSKKKKMNTVIEEILMLSEEYEVRSFLLGLPHAFIEKHRAIQEEIRDFAEILANKSKKKIYYYSETFSSVEASQFLGQFVATGTRDGRIDKMSAALFLQNFLDANNIHNKNKKS